MHIVATDKEIKQILESGFYKIPRFQRPYLWDIEDVTDFWQDITTDLRTDYFIGSFVVFKDGESLAVVDGQQRLTTITMLLCAIRNSFKVFYSEELASGIQSLIERRDVNNKLRYILKTETSYPYFSEYIQKNGPSELFATVLEDEGNLKNAFEYFSNVISVELTSYNTNAEKLRYLVKLRDKILKLKLIVIELTSEDDAYIIFETMNTRGKDLRASDYLKCLLTRLTKHTGASADPTLTKWNNIVKTISESNEELDIDHFLLHLWLSMYDYITEKQLFKELKRKIKDGTEARAFLELLVSESSNYRVLQDTLYGSWNGEALKLKNSLDALNMFKIKQDIPMLMSAYREYKSGRISLKNCNDIIEAIEKFHFIFTAITSRRSSGGISQMYSLHARTLYSKPEAEKIKTIRELKAKLRSKIPEYQVFESNYQKLYYTSRFTKNKKIIKYILSKINEYKKRTGVPIDYDRMTIEHIYPENPPEKRLPDDVVGQLGNLILVDSELNGQLDSKDFKEKMRILKEHPLIWLGDELEQADAWDKDKIVKRTKAMATLSFNEVWK